MNLPSDIVAAAVGYCLARFLYPNEGCFRFRWQAALQAAHLNRIERIHGSEVQWEPSGGWGGSRWWNRSWRVITRSGDAVWVSMRKRVREGR